MGRKNSLLKFQTITAGSMTGTSVITSTVTDVRFLDNIGYQFNFTGTPNGSFNIQVSVDYAVDLLGNVTNTGNWINLAIVPAPVASGAAAQIYVDLNQIAAAYIRAIYTNTSSTGTLNAFVTGKQLG